jgi:hypothetical protein
MGAAGWGGMLSVGLPPLAVSCQDASLLLQDLKMLWVLNLQIL